MAGSEKLIYNTEMYRVSEDDYSFIFDTKRMAFDKGSRDALLKFNKRYYKANNYNPSMRYAKKNFTADDADKRFRDELIQGIAIQTRIYSGNIEPLGVLSLSKGKLHFAFEKKASDTAKALPDNVDRLVCSQHSLAKQIADDVSCKSKQYVIVDPTSEDAKALIGKTVEISKTYNFVGSKIITLTDIFEDSPMPFTGKTMDEEKQISGVFIREHVVVRMPLNLDDKSVRDSLRGKWIYNKANGQECMVTSFRKVDGHYQCNGIDARSLMDSWELEDGGLLGVEK